MRTLVCEVENELGRELVSWESIEVGRSGVASGSSWRSLRSFMSSRGGTFYCYHLDFVGRFLVARLLDEGFRWVSREGSWTNGEFTTMFSEHGQCYGVSWQDRGRRVRVCDYTKLVRADMREVMRAFPGVSSKSEVMALSLEEMHREGINGVTIAQAALSDFKRTIGPKNFGRRFPPVSRSLDFDQEVRKAYHGGFCDVNHDYMNKDLEDIWVYDVKSLYPSILKRYPMPWGLPIEFDGAPADSDILWIASVTLSAAVKPDGVPFLMVKRNPLFDPMSYVVDTMGMQTLWLSSVDFLALQENYDLDVSGFNGGFAFLPCAGVFDDYVDKWYERKEESEGMRKVSAKLMLNSLVGKFGANVLLTDQVPVSKAGYLDFERGETVQRDGVYLPVSVFVNAFGRLELTRAIRSAGLENWIYSDTDSLHLLKPAQDGEFKLGSEMGQLDLKKRFDRGRYLSRKRYVGEVDGRLDMTCAGMPSNILERMTFDDFKVGWSNVLPDGSFRPGMEMWKPYPTKGGMVRRPYVFNL